MKDIPQGVALNNMMRQVGGSFGIAFINTFLDHRAAAQRSELVTQAASGRFATVARLRQLTLGMEAHGATPWEAPRRALAALDLMIQRQASLLSYLDAFKLVGMISLCCLPLILIASGSGRAPKSAAMAAMESH
jgi:DHA2 family multidrug resistance protein